MRQHFSLGYEIPEAMSKKEAAKLLERHVCHCLICQRLTQSDFADVVTIRGRSMRLVTGPEIRFARYRLPPAIRRGTVQSYGFPVIGLMQMAPYVMLGFALAKSFVPGTELPNPHFRVFYHRRKADAEDDLAKLNGYWPSVTAVTRAILARTFS